MTPGLQCPTAQAMSRRQLAREHRSSARNLVHYVAMRRRDLRDLQTRLADIGMSSIGRSEAYALSAVTQLVNLIDRLLGKPAVPPVPVPCNHSGGTKLLAKHARNLLGAPRSERAVRIMVTMPSEAAHDHRLIHALLANGMDCMRINCAHDDRAACGAMILHWRKARTILKRECRVLMDLPGPKLQTGRIGSTPAVSRIRPSKDVYGRVTRAAWVWISADPGARPPPRQHADGCLYVDPKWLAGIKRKSRILLVDIRGRRRRLKVAEVARGGVWAELDRTAYFTNGTVLTHLAEHKQAPTKTQIHGISPGEGSIPLSPGDALILSSDARGGRPAQMDSTGKVLVPATIPCTLPEALVRVAAGHRVSLDDGRFSGFVESTGAGSILVRIEQTPPGGARLKSDKGINLPDTDLDLPAISAADANDLEFIAQHADLVGLSFVNHERDVLELIERFKALTPRPPGIIVKIETKRGFERLPAILLTAMRHPRSGVMIARGDLAVECGYERLAELQEEILWMCEAAHCPAVWATQVLESMAKNGVPSRAEITDAAMSQRAECVMLNKGPYITDALRVLDHILKRMDPHQSKKTSRLRALNLALGFGAKPGRTPGSGAPERRRTRPASAGRAAVDGIRAKSRQRAGIWERSGPTP